MQNSLLGKRGVSAVIATVLIIMITVAAVGILWVSIIPLIKDSLGSSDLCKEVGISIISSQGYTCYKPNNITMVQVSKANNEVNVTGLTFSISSSGNSYDYDKQEVAYSTSEYNVYYLNTSEFEKIEKISVVPSVKSGDSEKICSVVFLEDIPLCSASINLVAVSAGRLIGRSGSGTADSPIVPPACVPNCSCAASTPQGQNCSNGCGGFCQGERFTDGTLTSPFIISTCGQLQNMSLNLSASYELVSNIDCSETINWNCEGGGEERFCKGFEPVGNCGEDNSYWGVWGYPDDNLPFLGNFNGNNYTISNLYINRSSTDCLGLFGYFTGSISNVGLENINITGTLAYIGGLVGYSNGVISNSHTSGELTCSSSAGGLVGAQSSGSISNSYSTVNLIGGSDIGGLVGYLVSSATPIYSSYSTGNITGISQVGGLVGSCWGSISNSYSTGNLIGGDSVGGLVGSVYCVISNSYSTGKVTGDSSVGGFIGVTNNLPISSYWDINTSGITNMCGYSYSGSCDNNYGITTEEMKNISTFNSTWDYTSIWKLVDGQYPKLQWQD